MAPTTAQKAFSIFNTLFSINGDDRLGNARIFGSGQSLAQRKGMPFS